MKRSQVVVTALIVFNVGILTSGLVVAGWPAGWLGFYRTLELKGGDDRILNANKQVRPGEILVYQFSYCKYTNRQATVTRTLRRVDSQSGYPLLPSKNNVKKGCGVATSTNLIVPEAVIPGKYRLELSATYQLNPLRSETVSHQSEPFEILPEAASSSVTPFDAPDGPSISNQAVVAPAQPVKANDPRTVQSVQPAPTSTPMPRPTSAPSPSPTPGFVQRLLQGLL